MGGMGGMGGMGEPLTQKGRLARNPLIRDLARSQVCTRSEGWRRLSRLEFPVPRLRLRGRGAGGRACGLYTNSIEYAKCNASSNVQTAVRAYCPV